MIRVRLQIADGEIVDTYDAYRLIYMDVKEHIFAPELVDFETSTHAEEEGEEIDPRTTFKAFDYVVQFLVEAPNSNIDNANRRIATFNKLLYDETEDSDIKVFKQVSFFNDDDKVKIVGYPKLISKATEFWRDRHGRQHDAVQVEWTIRVNKPSKCDFEL